MVRVKWGDFNFLSISQKAHLSEVVQTLESGGAQIALVVNEKHQLVGTITDGDVRRALLRGNKLDSLAEDIMCRKFMSLRGGATEREALDLMRVNSVHQVPVLDSQGRVVDLYLLDQLVKPEKLSNEVVIMAGGRGKRLYPLTQECPKPMLHIGGKPLLEIILQQCIDAGFNSFHFSVNYLKEKIKEYFEDGSSWGVEINYLEEAEPLGTAGALGLLTKKITEPVLVINGDVLTRVDFGSLINFHNDHGFTATMCVREQATQIPYGVAHINDLHILKLEEKPVLSHYVNAGVYLLSPSLLSLLPLGCFFDMPQLLEKAIEHQEPVGAFPIHEYWLDVGHHETLERAKGEWLKL